MNSLLSNTGYVLSPSTSIWVKPGYGSISYSDGYEVEQRIADIIAKASDITVLSTELRQYCTDWASIYHLSATRANILRPFHTEFRGVDVLEIGAGCGAITRYLGESGANVLALEGTVERAQITRSRTRDLSNVAVVADSFNEFELDKKFDYITLIGVLEYANLFTPGDFPAIAMLTRVRRMLKPGGKLIIAIENQFGLKYFAGALEDHLGEAMYGIEGRYEKNQPQTYGHETLRKMLRESNFEGVEFLAPFPDYKLPTSIVSEAGFQADDFDASAFAWQSARRDPQLPAFMNFSMELAWPGIFENQIALELANSFLVIASLKPADSIVNQVLAYHYSTDRVSTYCKETQFIRRSCNSILVRCQSLAKAAEKSINSLVIFEPEPEAGYVLGVPLSWGFVKIVTRDGWRMEEVTNFFKNYLAIVYQLGFEDKSTDKEVPNIVNMTLPGVFFDFTPQNIICKRDGSYSVIDTEWKSIASIPAARLIFRSILWLVGLVTQFGRSADGNFVTRLEFIKEIFKCLNLVEASSKIESYLEQESIIQEKITGKSVSEFLRWWLSAPLPALKLSSAITTQDEKIVNLGQTLAARDVNIDTLNQRLIHLEINELGAYREQAEEFAHQVKALQDQLEATQSAIQHKDGELGAYREQANEFARQVKALQDQLEATQSAIQHKDGELGAYREQAEKFSHLVRELQEQLASTQVAVQHRDVELGAYREQAEEFALQFVEIKAQVIDLQNKIEMLTAERTDELANARFLIKRLTRLTVEKMRRILTEK